MALFPGVSRSGSTTWTGTRLGLSHANAAKYSFFLGMVAIAGAAAKTAWDVVKGKDVVAFPTGALVVGFVVSALVSFAVIRWLLNFFRKHTLVPFGVYLMVLGAIVLVWPWK